jgi:hypothetical protein
MAPEQKWLTVGEVAAILGVTTETVRNKIKRGELPASRASNAPHAAFLIDAAEFERQRAVDVELAAVRQRLAGVVTGRGEEFIQQLEQQYPGVTVGAPDGPTLAEHVRATINRHELFERIQSEMAADPGVQSRLRELDEAERFEAEAQEIARRIRRDEELLKRAREILDEELD